jgi:hypothetical protein
METIDDIKASMKLIIEQTNNVLKHSTSAFKKAKEKLLVLNDVAMKPSEQTKKWFHERKILTITAPVFFDLVFQEASVRGALDFNAKTIMFCESDAIIFGFEPDTPIPIVTFFENLPNYFD